MSIKQGGEEFGIKADKYYEALKLQDDGDYFESIRAWSEVLDDEPRFAQGHFNIGLIYDMLNMVPEAIEHYELAVQAAEESKDMIGNGNEARESAADTTASIALYNAHLGAAYLRGGLIDEAITALQKAEVSDQYNPMVHYNLAAAFMAKGNYEMALKQADIAVDLIAKPDGKTTSGLSTDVDTDRLAAYLLRQGKCHIARAEWDKAKACFDRITVQCHGTIPAETQAELDAGMKAAQPKDGGDEGSEG
ncbi:MAG: tetratricopeptide repeat protein [Planctomycetes bacterium]|nr:tetratricopeptide repeat protein [Planctomycetota bacterium]